MITAVWRLRTTGGKGWVQHVNDDGTVKITGVEAWAIEWPTRAEAEAIAGRVSPGRIGLQAVPGPPTPEHLRQRGAGIPPPINWS